MGLIDGVLGTHSAWIGPHEVVEVTYDPARVGYAELLGTAVERGCASRAWLPAGDARLDVAREALGDRAAPLEGAPRPAKESDQLYYLGLSPLRFVPLTPLQAVRVNGALGLRVMGLDGPAPEDVLSPRQRALASRVASALERDATALDGLARPAERDRLAEFAIELDARLDGLGH